MTELKKCPKGHDAEMETHDTGSAGILYSAGCVDSYCWCGPIRDTPEETAAEWNALMQAWEDSARFRETLPIIQKGIVAAAVSLEVIPEDRAAYGYIEIAPLDFVGTGTLRGARDDERSFGDSVVKPLRLAHGSILELAEKALEGTP